MAKRGRPAKTQLANEAKTELKMLEAVVQRQKEILYKDLATIKKQVDYALTQVGFMDNCESVSEAAFKAGRAYGPLDEANDKLEELLEELFEANDFKHWEELEEL